MRLKLPVPTITFEVNQFLLEEPTLRGAQVSSVHPYYSSTCGEFVLYRMTKTFGYHPSHVQQKFRSGSVKYSYIVSTFLTHTFHTY
jgi:hypothetical protein